MEDYADAWEVCHPESVQPAVQNDELPPTLAETRKKKLQTLNIPSAGYTFDTVINTMLTGYEQVC